jgi:CO/xanthine dehydrogenase Mo-binding subunit
VIAGWSRRDFLKSSGVLVVRFGAGALIAPVAAEQGPFDTRASHIDPQQLDSWIAITADGRVTAYTGKCELGQGIHTAQTQLVAEELCVPVDWVTLIQCDTAVSPDQGTTSGSQSTPANFNDRNLAQASASAREALLRLASERLGPPASDLSIAAGVVTSKSNPSRQVTYRELLAGRRFDLRVDPRAARKPSGEWTVLGTSVPRLDMLAMATGTLEYVHNVKVDGMLHGTVVRPPSVRARLAAVDESSVRGLAGVVSVVVRNNFVGVVAQKPWQARQAANRLKASWTETGGRLPSREGFHGALRTGPSRDALVVDSRDVDEHLAASATIITATYTYPYQMHGSVGTSCAVADVQGERVTVWSATQSAYPTRNSIAALLNISPENVRIVFTRGSGCYGLNGADAVSFDAALLSHAVGKPVRVQLSRQDEMAWENYGAPFVVDQRAGLDPSGTILAWACESWSAALGGRPGYDTPGNVVSGMLAGLPPAPFRAQAAAGQPAQFNNNGNAAPSYVAGRVAGRSGGTGVVASERVVTHVVPSPFFTGPLRSPSRLQQTFAHECFMDEIAARVRADPIGYRLRHLRDPRLKEVVEAVAKAARWDPRPSPRPVSARAGTASGRGVACVLYEGDNGYVAMVAEVDVEWATGRVVARRLVVAQDCGPVSNPDGMRSQLEGGALQGLSRALGEEVTWDARRITSVDWSTYRSLTLGAEMPVVESVLVNRPGVEAAGAGETAITIVAAAVGNAIFDATGVRIRDVPFTPDRVRAALL